MTTYTAHEILGGLYENTVKMTVSRRLADMPYAQAGWIDTVQQDGTTASDFYSYSSKIFTAFRAVVEGRQVVEGISTNDSSATSTYSRTTSRQCTSALRELGLCDKEVRSIKRYLDRGGKFALLYHYASGAQQWCDAFTGEVIE